MDLAIVIVNWNGRELLQRCLQSIAETANDIDHEVWVVDNCSTDGSQTMVQARFPAVRLLASQHNLGFAGGNNVALRQILALDIESSEQLASLTPDQRARLPRFVLLLNPDTIVQPGALQALLRYMRARPYVGAAGALLLNEDRSFQASHIKFPSLRREFLILSGIGRKLYGESYPSAGPAESQRSRDNIDYVVGACIIARSEAVREVGVLDAGFFMYSEEVDWCYRFRASGWPVGYAADAVIVHLGGGSTRLVRPQMLAELYRSRARYFEKHRGRTTAIAFRLMLLAMNGTKLVRATLRRGTPVGTPPLTWPLLRHAISSTKEAKVA